MEFFRPSAPYEDATQRKRAVINIVDNTAVPPTEVLGDRYILDNTGGGVNAGWDGASINDIVEFDGSVWIAETPSEGWITYVDYFNVDYRYIDDGTGEWEEVKGGGQRKRAVIDLFDTFGGNPPTEVEGDRYIITTSSPGAGWDGAVKNDIVEFNGTVWIAETPEEGVVAYVDDKNTDARYVEDGSGAWELLPINGGVSVLSGGTIDLSAGSYQRQIIYIVTSLSCTVTPPAVADFDTLRIFRRSGIGAGTVTVGGTDTVNGVANPQWATGYGCMTIFSDGSNLFSPIDITP